MRCPCHPLRRQPLLRRQAGQVAIEAIVLAVLVVLVLFIGDPSPIEQLLAAIQRTYGRFTYAIAMP